MPIDLTQFERAVPFAGDFQAALGALQDRLERLQLAQIASGKSAIIVVEGWQASGRRAALRSIAGAWDPCHFTVVQEAGDEDQRHWLACYWASLPRPGCTTFYFPSWHARLLDRRIDGSWHAKHWTRGCDEVNEFEAQQSDHGNLVVKLFFHLGAAAHAERLRRRADDPWGDVGERSAEMTPEERAARMAALGDLLAETDTRWAPWRLIDAGDEPSARIAALGAVAEALEKAVPAQSPVERGTVVPLQRKHN